jgi:hypothetical protein
MLRYYKTEKGRYYKELNGKKIRVSKVEYDSKNKNTNKSNNSSKNAPNNSSKNAPNNSSNVKSKAPKVKKNKTDSFNLDTANSLMNRTGFPIKKILVEDNYLFIFQGIGKLTVFDIKKKNKLFEWDGGMNTQTKKMGYNFVNIYIKNNVLFLVRQDKITLHDLKNINDFENFKEPGRTFDNKNARDIEFLDINDTHMFIYYSNTRKIEIWGFDRTSSKPVGVIGPINPVTNLVVNNDFLFLTYEEFSGGINVWKIKKQDIPKINKFNPYVRLTDKNNNNNNDEDEEGEINVMKVDKDYLYCVKDGKQIIRYDLKQINDTNYYSNKLTKNKLIINLEGKSKIDFISKMNIDKGNIFIGYSMDPSSNNNSNIDGEDVRISMLNSSGKIKHNYKSFKFATEFDFVLSKNKVFVSGFKKVHMLPLKK